MFTGEQKEVIKRCQASAIWFMQNFIKVKHQGAGIVPFNPFDYQKNAIKSFRKNRMNIFRKTRQCFTGDQIVNTPDGRKAISDIRAGDKVWSYSPNDILSLDPGYYPQFVESTVNEVYINPPAPLCRVIAGKHESITTHDHRYFTTRGEVEAGKLREDDWLITMSPNGLDEVNRSQVEQIGYISGDSGPLYDLNVDYYHNYVVDGAVVHNCGISKVSGVFALWFAMFNSNKTILIVSRKDEDAMTFLSENVKLPFSYLPDWMKRIWKPVKDNDHELELPNGSKIKSLTSHPEVLRSNSSALNIIDEAAFIDNMDAMWAAGRPTLTHGGSVIVISTCVAPDTYVWTADGMTQIKDLAPKEYEGFEDGYFHAKYNGPAVLGINGLEMPSKYYKRPKEKTKKITYTGGYELEASLLHKVIAVHDDGSIGRKLVQDLKIGDYIPIKSGAMVFGNNDIINYDVDGFKVDKITPELGYLVGVATAKGHLRERDIALSCDDDEVLQRCMSWGNIHWYRRKSQNYVVVSARPRFCRFLKWLGMEYTTASFKQVPKRLWPCSEPIIRAFLQGLYDGDGSSRTRDGEVCLTSTSKNLIDQVRQLLFNYGIICRIDISDASETKFERESGYWTIHKTKIAYRLCVTPQDTIKFYDLVGFCLERKQRNRSKARKTTMRMLPPCARNLINQFRSEVGMTIATITSLGIAPNVLFQRPTFTIERLQSFLTKLPEQYKHGEAYNKLVALASYDRYLKVESLENSESEVYDFTMPDTHTFIANGTVNLNTNGVGNWYWNTWTDAEAGVNEFKPLMVNWWDMTWRIEYKDALSGEVRTIAPTDGVKPTGKSTYGMHHRYGKIELDPKRYGKFWSPWLEEQYRDLQEKGEGWKFDQEILAEFVGSGNTVISKDVLHAIEQSVVTSFQLVTGNQIYVHPVNGDQEVLDFTPSQPNEGLWIWKRPVRGTPDKIVRNRVVEPGIKSHTYVAGIDFSTGKGRDYHGIEIFDVDEREQVAEGMFHCLPNTFTKMIDRIGREYNTALLVPERNNGGDIIIDQLLNDYSYPRIWRRSRNNGKTVSFDPFGFFTSQSSKPALNKFMLDFLRESPELGFRIYSARLLKQLSIYVRKRDKAGRDTGKTEAESGVGNHDDLVMAMALAFAGVLDAVDVDAVGVTPFRGDQLTAMPADHIRLALAENRFQEKGNALMPMSFGGEQDHQVNIQEELLRFAMQIGALPLSAMADRLEPTHEKKHQLKYRNNK